MRKPMIDVHIDKRKFNSAYLPYLDDQTRTQIFFGGAASGKSVFLAQRDVCDVLRGKRNILVVRNVGRTIRGSVFNEIRKVIDEWGLARLFSINKSDMVFTCVNGYQIISTGLDDTEKIKSVTPRKGVITDIRIEEATEIGEDDFRQLTKRLRGKAGVSKRITLSFNPIMRTHWIFKEFFKNFHDTDTDYHDPELDILKTTYKDNRFLEPDDIHFLESEKNEYYYNVYTLGQWGVLGHVIFTNWRVENLTGLRDAFGTYYNGLDYGYTADPTCFGRCAIKGKTLYITHGFYKYGMTNDLIAARIKPMIGKEPVRCDPSEPKSTAELRALGISAMSASGGRGSVNQGIQFIQQHEVVIHRDLQDAINEFQLYQWERNRAGETMNVPVDKNNHWIDQLRYSLSGVSMTQPKQQGTFDPRMTGLPIR